MQSKLLIFLLALCLSLVTSIRADSWMAPTEKIQRSADGSKQVRLIPRGTTNSDLIISAITDHATNKLWSVQTKNLPSQLHLSNNASNLVTCNSWASVGYGDYVIAIYSPDGEIAHHSLESFAPPPPNNIGIRGFEYQGIFPLSTSSRWWDQESFKFFHPC